MKKDDWTLGVSDMKAIRKRADLLLRKAEAYGRFPVPVDDLVEAAKLEIEREASLDEKFLGRIYKSLPNSLKTPGFTIKRAAKKVWGLLDRRGRMIYLDHEVYPQRKTFITIHEIGHDFMEWQRKVYAMLEDSECELDETTQDLFERQANCFSSDVIFQLDGFKKEAADHEFGILTPTKLAKRYGSSVHAAQRRFVATNDRPCVLLVFNKPITTAEGEAMTLRRCIPSPAFQKRFGDRQWPKNCGPGSFFVSHLPRNKVARPTPWQLENRNGEKEECLLEAFRCGPYVFFLIYTLARKSRRSIRRAG